MDYIFNAAQQETVTALGTVCESFLGMWVTLLPYSHRLERYLPAVVGRLRKIGHTRYQIADIDFSPEDILDWGTTGVDKQYLVYDADELFYDALVTEMRIC